MLSAEQAILSLSYWAQVSSLGKPDTPLHWGKGMIHQGWSAGYLASTQQSPFLSPAPGQSKTPKVTKLRSLKIGSDVVQRFTATMHGHWCTAVALLLASMHTHVRKMERVMCICGICVQAGGKRSILFLLYILHV